MPTQSLRPKQAQPNARQQLKVQQLLVPEIERLQQQELQAAKKLSINKPINQIPRQNIKKAVKASPKPNRLEAPYKKTTAKTPVKPESRTLTFGDTTIELPRDQHKLEALKQEALDYWKNLPEIT
ncbi:MULTISPECIES: hypothetical protein [unclassified Prochlorococcus]|uniref:hypothetical protein n=1 Tax=unclassified Prochlorococcus TaxID=2627481 RepID=UPI0005339F0B|nr:MULTISPECIES: hypothetical protein [unclassified Prochlorococcus]KGG29006.1 hypothetical protein EV12_0270 [Prochlorococcus sp. MIT 0701]KGG29966.1 hypothetical protein EV13_0770 [Prochlorococcus sp. MIT 0702]KGG36968.1 hypothetical protein EV14_0178 [Prochlorococcus sp. MIT 0703]